MVLSMDAMADPGAPSSLMQIIAMCDNVRSQQDLASLEHEAPGVRENVETQNLGHSHAIGIHVFPTSTLLRRHRVTAFCLLHHQSSHHLCVVIHFGGDEHNDAQSFHIVIIWFLFKETIDHRSPSRW